MLTDSALKHLKGKAKRYKVTDRDGMYAFIMTTGVISFRYDYRINGRRETLVIGKYGRDGISLAAAREKCLDARRAVRAVPAGSQSMILTQRPGRLAPSSRPTTVPTLLRRTLCPDSAFQWAPCPAASNCASASASSFAQADGPSDKLSGTVTRPRPSAAISKQTHSVLLQ